ncbi:MAG: hypothetical protein WCS31_04765 [Verrucomicrobiae bacterium]
MNADIERGFVAVIQAAMPGVHVREATSSKPHPSDVQMVIVQCAECEHVVGPLYRATVKAFLGTPAFDMGESQHREATGMLALALLDPAAAATLFNPVADHLTLHGFHVRSQSEEIVDNTWRATVELLAGIRFG